MSETPQGLVGDPFIPLPGQRREPEPPQPEPLDQFPVPVPEESADSPAQPDEESSPQAEEPPAAPLPQKAEPPRLEVDFSALGPIARHPSRPYHFVFLQGKGLGILYWDGKESRLLAVQHSFTLELGENSIQDQQQIELRSPQGILSSAKDNCIWVSDTKNNRVIKLVPTVPKGVESVRGGGAEWTEAQSDYDEEFICNQIIGAEGRNPGQFKWPCGLTTIHDNIAVADSGNARLQLFCADGQFLRTVHCEALKDPAGIVFHEVARKSVFGLAGTHQTAIVADNTTCEMLQIRVNDLGVAKLEGNLFNRFGDKGSGPCQFEAPDTIQIVEMGGSHRIAVADCNNHRIQVLDLEGKFVKSFGSGRLSRPAGICQDNAGYLLVSDSKKGEITAWSTQDGHWAFGHTLLMASRRDPGAFNPVSLALHPKTGNLFVLTKRRVPSPAWLKGPETFVAVNGVTWLKTPTEPVNQTEHTQESSKRAEAKREFDWALQHRRSSDGKLLQSWTLPLDWGKESSFEVLRALEALGLDIVASPLSPEYDSAESVPQLLTDYQRTSNGRIQFCILDAIDDVHSGAPSLGRPAGLLFLGSKALNPKSLARHSQGHIFYADTQRHKIRGFDMAGAEFWGYGGKGKKENSLCSPSDVVIDEDFGQLWVSDTGNSRIVLIPLPHSLVPYKLPRGPSPKYGPCKLMWPFRPYNPFHPHWWNLRHPTCLALKGRGQEDRELFISDAGNQRIVTVNCHTLSILHIFSLANNPAILVPSVPLPRRFQQQSLCPEILRIVGPQPISIAVTPEGRVFGGFGSPSIPIVPLSANEATRHTHNSGEFRIEIPEDGPKEAVLGWLEKLSVDGPGEWKIEGRWGWEPQPQEFHECLQL